MIHDADFTDEQLLLTNVQVARVLSIERTTTRAAQLQGTKARAGYG